MTDFSPKTNRTPQRLDASEPVSLGNGGSNGSDPPALHISQPGSASPEFSPKPNAASTRKAGNQSKAPKPWKPLYQRWWAWVVLGFSAATVGGGVATANMLERIRSELPKSDEVLTYVRNGTLTIKASDGAILQQLGPATRDKLELSKIPDLLSKAFIASEDKNFYEHDGVDYWAIVRATRANFTAGEVVEGASTITQQLARIVFLDQERSLERKLREALLAQKIEHDLTKDKVLERYLNLVYLGSGAYGVADAAWIYFSKPVDKLTLSEMAMIAGMPPAPSDYSPLVNPDLAKQRRDIVLTRMVEAGYITTAQMEDAKAEPLTLKPSIPRNLYSEVPYFTSYVQQQLPKLVSPEQLETGGLTVETTLNLEWQRKAQDTIKNAINNYGPGQNFSQAAMVVIDPRSGAIKALVGGNDFEKSQFNRAVQAQRQPGSTFKVFVYTTAIAAGFSPYKTYEDSKFVVDGYEPQNYSRNYRGTVSIKDALTSSINIVAVKALIDVGFDPVINMAKRMGIKSELNATYSLALGASEVNLLELTSGYGTLANRGNYIEPHGIVRVLDRYGKVIYQADTKPTRAVDEGTAAIMTWMLRGVVSGGTGARAALPDRPVAGKTGTSEQRRDLWFIGYIPQLVVGVWLGNDNNRPTWGASSTAARTWRDFVSQVTAEIPVEQFPELPRLEGRKGSIEAQPAKPRRVSNSSSRSSSEERDEAPRRSRSTSTSTPEESRSPEREPEPSNEPESNSRERRNPPAERPAPAPEPPAASNPEPAAPPPPPEPVAPPAPVAPPPPPPPAPAPVAPSAGSSAAPE